MYNECIQITRQFTFCPNAFRVDLYKGCDFGCRYCFANMDWAQEKQKGNWDLGDIEKIKRLFKKALETDVESKDILVELIRHRVPIHCGGMSDPFQKREWEHHLTKQLIELSNKYDYPIQFSTKTSFLPDEYYEILNPKIHAFQVSIIGWDDWYVKRWECNTASTIERLDFVKQLRDKGFWCGLRIQPIIDVVQCEKLCYNLKEVFNNINMPNYVSLEHFKLVLDVHSSKNAFLKYCDNKEDFTFINHKMEFKRNVKIENIKRLKSILNDLGILVGDNDLHYMSDSRCCCGIDLIESFQGYLKYNLTYFCTGDFKDEWVPECNPRKHINDQKYGLQIDCKEYVRDYIALHKDYLGTRRNEIERKLFGITTKRLL